MLKVNLGDAMGRSLSRWLRPWVSRLLLAGAGGLVAVTPAQAADDIIITYGFFERTVDIGELETFAETGNLSPQLSTYADNLGLSVDDLATIRATLGQRADLSAVDVAQFLYTLQGKTLLRFVGDIVQTPTRQSGFHAIRAGLILAAADTPDGLTIINFLKHYPNPAIRVDVGRGLDVAAEVTDVLGDTKRAIALIHSQAAVAARQPMTGLEQAEVLMNALPPFSVKTEPLVLPFRGVEATLFLPQPRSLGQTLPTNIPVIVISHGLGDERDSYEYLASYLARRGFAVATLDHPGSNSRQIDRLLSGLSANVIDNREFVDRPEDVSAVIDEIQRFAINSRDYRWRLNTQNVGLVGQSFGGYTALALAGATFDAEALTTACEPQPIYLNPSLLLQCQATAALPPTSLRDDRVQAILAVNPVGSGIFGPEGFAAIEVPVMMMAATGDTVAPALPEQIEPFTWLQTAERYLVLASGMTHFSVIDWPPTAEPLIPVPAALLGDDPEVAQDYLQALSLAFFQKHLQQDRRYEPVLSARFASESIARSPLTPLSLIRDLSPEALEQALESTDTVVSDRPQ